MTSADGFANRSHTSRSHSQYDQQDDDDETSDEETFIEWSNFIFLPFHPVFELVVMTCVIVKCLMAPLRSIYPVIYCNEQLENNIYFLLLKYFYWYLCDAIYALDTFLHMAHRQVADKAMRREHLPKSAFLLLIDIISLVPFFSIFADEICPPTKLFPNILTNTEFIVIYRIAQYFDLTVTHSLFQIVVGFSLVFICFINFISCFWLLLTFHGLCSYCTGDIYYDWRHFVRHKLGEQDVRITTFIYGTVFIMAYIVNQGIDDIKPSTVSEFVIIGFLVILGYLLSILIFLPKVFAESILKLRRVFAYHPHVQRLVDETRRRHSDPQAQIDVENFYNLLWKKRSGIVVVPEVLKSMPKYLRVDLHDDLVWHIFFHSPILRKTSQSFRRMICELVVSDYKLPGEKFFSGLHSLTNFYYLKSGTVQFLSSDDGITPILSLTSGTVFGDISFLCPPLNRRVLVRCLTYCEVLFLPRLDYLKTLHKYPEDRKQIIAAAKARLKHAKSLFDCKLNVRGSDRSEDENIVWLKRRWWEISRAINSWRKTCNKREDTIRCPLPIEDTVFHCAKYIGQLVLCHETKLQKKSIFASVDFPWILLPSSPFNLAWNRFVLATVVAVLIIYPPMLATPGQSRYFKLFRSWVNFVYLADVCVSLFTSVTRKEDYTENFATVMFERCKTLNFFLDFMAAIWIEDILVIFGMPQYYRFVQMNRLIKVYIIFQDLSHWSLDKDPLVHIFFRISIIQFCYTYIMAHSVYMLFYYVSDLTKLYWFGTTYCYTQNGTRFVCKPSEANFFGVYIAWTLECVFTEHWAVTLSDIYVACVVACSNFLLSLYCKALILAALYLSFREATNFQDFVSNLKKYYVKNDIHEDLLKRLDRYLLCHWKYYKGVDIMHPTLLKNEPYDIYWKVQGEIAEKIVGESLPFVGASQQLIRELAYASKFMILPKNSTVFLFGVHCRNVTWVVQGYIRCEYHDDDGQLLTSYLESGYLLSITSVFFGKTSLRTYTAHTDCEVIHIRIQDFYKILKRYPEDWHHFNSVIRECTPMFDDLYADYMEKHVDYKKALRKRIFHARASMVQTRISRESRVSTSLLSNKLKVKKIPISLSFKEEIVDEHKAKFLKYWLVIRVVAVIIAIISSSLQGGSGAFYRKPLIVIGYICDFTGWMDIFLKISLAYYDENGIVIYSRGKCAAHYFTRGFLLDIIGCIPWYRALRLLISHTIDDNDALLLNTACKYAHLYLVMGYMEYIGDKPTLGGTVTIILKWQIFLILVMFGASQLMISYCIYFDFDESANLIGMVKREECWLPDYYEVGDKPTAHDLHLLFSESLNIVQCGLMRMSFGLFILDRTKLGIGVTMITLTIIYWYVMSYSVTLLVLNSRGNVLFQHGVSQLEAFLKSERVEPRLIRQALTHFTYWWTRTNGINIHHLSNERLGVVFRQDLNYYFYHKTFTALDNLLNGGKSLERQLASNCIPQYVLPRHEIVREMDLTSNIYIVHKGVVRITRENEEICVLTRGSIFGQLDGTTKSRTIQISAVADDYVDLLPINVKTFHELITDKVRATIAVHPTSKLGYMMTKKYYAESPFETVRYTIGIRQTVKLPFMKTPTECRTGHWYYRFLFFVWFVEPFITSFITIGLISLPLSIVEHFYYILLISDTIHLVHLIMEFYSMKLTIKSNMCVPEILGLSLFREVHFYFDLSSILLPSLSFVLNVWLFQMFRLLRLRLLYMFYLHFCTSFKSRIAPILLRLVCILLGVHSLACLWIFVACRDEVFPLNINSTGFNIFIDRDQWVETHQRVGGCARLTVIRDSNKTEFSGFLKPKHMENDYFVAITYVLMLLTHILITTVVPVTIKQVYFKIFLNYSLYLLDMVLFSAGINFMYTLYRELYQHDYNVQSLLTFLKQSGISPSLLQSVKDYTKHIWKRQKGDWIPELAQTAPICIRQDLFCALYIHHLQTPVLFRSLPIYFIRQVAARLKRIVVFPGKHIVQEGDISPIIYWIHEGEVEKWCKNQEGEDKMISLLSTNGYFGFIPGLFPNIPFQFSYCTRTVVDIVYLRLNDWQDLLNGYPDIKMKLYEEAKQMRKDIITNRKSIY